MNFRSKLVKAIGITLSLGHIGFNSVYANPKFSEKDIRGEFETFFYHKDAAGFKDNGLCLKRGIPKDEDLESLIKGITNLANFAYYAQMLTYARTCSVEECSNLFIDKKTVNKVKAEAERLEKAIIELGAEIDKVSKRKVYENVRYSKESLNQLQTHVDSLMDVVNNSLCAEEWEEMCFPDVFILDPFLSNLLYVLEGIIKSGKVEDVFGASSSLCKKFPKKEATNKSNSEYDITINEPCNSSIISSFSISQGEYEKLLARHQDGCEICRRNNNHLPPLRCDEHKHMPLSKPCANCKKANTCSDYAFIKGNGETVHKVFNLMLCKLYNDYLHFFQYLYGEGKSTSTEHRLLPASSNSPMYERYKSIGINFYNEN